jgi:DNA primase
MNDFEKVCSEVDLVDVIQSKYSVDKFKARGSRYSGCCPLHKEKTPSFSVQLSTNRFKCFGCGEGGSVIDFVSKMDGISLREAMYKIAGWYGVEVSKVKEVPEEDKRRTAIYAYAKAYFQDSLFNAIRKDMPIKHYLKHRGIKDKDFLYFAVRKFGLGYAPLTYMDPDSPSNPSILEQSFTKEYLMDAGLYREKGPFFRERMMFPICDRFGKVIAFTGRIIDDNSKYPKYLNSAEYSQFQKSKVWYAFHHAFETIRKDQEVIIVEGQMDVLFMHYKGFSNTIGMSSSSISEYQAKMLSRYAQKAILIPDGDAKAPKVKAQILALISAGLEVEVMELVDDGDPAQHLQNFGELQGEMKDIPTWIVENITDKNEAIELASKQADSLKRYEYYKNLAVGMQLPMKIIENIYKST